MGDSAMSSKARRLFKQYIFIPIEKNYKHVIRILLDVYANWRDKKIDDKSLRSAIDMFYNQFPNLKFDDIKQKILKQCRERGLIINLDCPLTIQDKLNWIKLYDLIPLKSKCADKIHLHKYCEEKLGKDICVPLIEIYNNSEEIDFDKMPKQFVIKCNHGCGMNIIVKDKSQVNLQTIMEQLNKWLNDDFGLYSLELHYLKIPKKIFVEQYMSDENQKNSLYDYKFWCFNGTPKYYTINDSIGHGDILYYDVETNDIKDFYGVLKHDKSILTRYEKPKNFELMKIYAKKLSSDFKFVRVDFYEVDNKVYLGELTFTPGAGMFRYKKIADEIKMGNLLNLS